MEREPITIAAELAPLDDAEVIEGYHDGFAGDAEPGGNRSLSYWHGWRNGAVDGGHRTKDEAQAALAHDYLRSRPRPSVASETKAPAVLGEVERG